MGSGKRLNQAYKKYGKENFKKEIIKFFDSAKDAYEYESKIVNDTLIEDVNCYNLVCGGKSPCKDKILVKYKDSDKYFFINRDKYDTNIHSTTWTNKHHNKEVKEKIRNSMLSRQSSVNKRIWVSKDGITKYIRKTLLDDYIKNGWMLGRINYHPRKNFQGKKL